MFLDDFDKYREHYEKGVKHISLRSMRNRDRKNVSELNMIESSPKIALFYNPTGLLIYSINYYLNQKTIFSYDRKGNIISILNLSRNVNEFESFTEIHYDESFKVIQEKKSLLAFTKPVFYNVAKTYSYKPFCTEILDTSFDDDSIRKYIMSYNQNNQLIDQKIYVNNELHIWVKFEYDSKGNLNLEITLDEDEKITSKTIYLNRNGLNFEYVFESDDTNYKRRYEHFYNSSGHWIKQFIYTDDVLHFINDRNIEYY